jgi:translation initiation factor IF-1
VPREDAITVEVEVVEALGNGLFRAELSNGHRVLAHSSRKDRERVAALAPRDRVRLEMSPFDMSKGRILVENDKFFKHESSRISKKAL